MRTSRYGYATINGAHILGIALLAGSIITLDLKLLGAWPRADRMSLVRVLVPVATTGFVIVAISGSLLFSAQATEYVKLPVFQIKMGLVLAGILSAASLHLRYGPWLEMAPLDRKVYLAALSLLIWICALFAGRFIAFSAT
ncbi:MAG: DUF2214 domain-containing protein [Hyphomicrobiales bacterium]